MGMMDKRQVMYDIEVCISHVPDACRDCSHYTGKVGFECMENLLTDALALLKEQQEEIENLKQTAQSMMEGIVVSTSMFYPCGSCQEFNCDFCKYKDFKRRVKWE